MKRFAWVAVAVVLVVIGAAAISRKVSSALHPPPAPDRTVAARTGDITVKVTESGTIGPVDKVDIKSKVAGRLLTLPIEEGQRVTRGQLIATVDRSLLNPQIDHARATLAQAQSRLAQSIAAYTLQVQQSRLAVVQAQAGLRTAQASLLSAQAHLAAASAGSRPQEIDQQEQAVKRAQISSDDAVRALKRKQALLERGFVSQADADSAQTAADTAASTLVAAQQQLALLKAGPRAEDIADARAQCDTARTQVAAARVQVATAEANAGQDAVRQADIVQSRAAVQQSQNDLQQLLVQLSDTQIVAPSAGVVLKKYKQPNEIVQSATTGFSDVQSIVATLGSRLQVTVGINEVDVPHVRSGAPAVIHIDAFPNASWSGHVSEIAPAASNVFPDAGSGGSQNAAIAKFTVKVALDSADGRLLPGMTAGVDILSAKRAGVVLAPLEAVQSDPGATKGTVTVLGPKGAHETRAVTLGLRDDTDVEIVRGVKAGELLVVQPVDGSGRRKINFEM